MWDVIAVPFIAIKFFAIFFAGIVFLSVLEDIANRRMTWHRFNSSGFVLSAFVSVAVVCHIIAHWLSS